MEKRHMTQRRQGLQSTKKAKEAEQIDPMETPEQEKDNAKTNLVFMALEDLEGKAFSEQTGRMPATSNRGYKYLVVFYIYDANLVLSYPIKSRSADELLCVYKKVYQKLTSKGFKPQFHKLDNELSELVESFLAE